MTTDRKQTKYRNRRREPQDAHDRSLTVSVVYMAIIHGLSHFCTRIPRFSTTGLETSRPGIVSAFSVDFILYFFIAIFIHSLGHAESSSGAGAQM